MILGLDSKEHDPQLALKTLGLHEFIFMRKLINIHLKRSHGVILIRMLHTR